MTRNQQKLRSSQNPTQTQIQLALFPDQVPDYYLRTGKPVKPNNPRESAPKRD